MHVCVYVYIYIYMYFYMLTFIHIHHVFILQYTSHLIRCCKYLLVEMYTFLSCRWCPPRRRSARCTSWSRRRRSTRRTIMTSCTYTETIIKCNLISHSIICYAITWSSHSGRAEVRVRLPAGRHEHGGPRRGGRPGPWRQEGHRPWLLFRMCNIYIYIYILSSSWKRSGVFFLRFPSERQPRSCSSRKP